MVEHQRHIWVGQAAHGHHGCHADLERGLGDGMDRFQPEDRVLRVDEICMPSEIEARHEARRLAHGIPDRRADLARPVDVALAAGLVPLAGP